MNQATRIDTLAKCNGCGSRAILLNNRCPACRKLDDHAGFRCIQAILGDSRTRAYVLGKLGGVHELQDLICELATKAGEDDVNALLADNTDRDCRPDPIEIVY